MPSPTQSRLRLVDSLLAAVEQSLSSLQKLLVEVHNEIGTALREEVDSSRDEELYALRREVAQLREGMASRAVIERAKGMVMQGRSLTESQAFDLLNELSQRGHRKLRDVAAEIVTGEAQARGAPASAAVPASAARPERPADEPGMVVDGASSTTGRSTRLASPAIR